MEENKSSNSEYMRKSLGHDHNPFMPPIFNTIDNQRAQSYSVPNLKEVLSTYGHSNKPVSIPELFQSIIQEHSKILIYRFEETLCYSVDVVILNTLSTSFTSLSCMM